MERDLVDEALAKFGLIAATPVAPQLEPLYLLPCNLRSWNFFQAVQTQWLVAEGCATGLSYPGVESAMSMSGVKRRDRADLFDDVRVMELATLAAWDERREKNG